MENHPLDWPERFGLATCAVAEIEKSIPADALGVAVVYTRSGSEESVFLVVESRAGGLLAQCQRRLQTAKFPAGAALSVAFKAEALPTSTPEAVHAACREQVILAGALRRELRPGMR